jgi:beta-galactosidase
MVKVYSNCEKAELFLNGKSLGFRTRNSQDFPVAGLRWMTPFVEGANKLRVVAQKGSITVTDEIVFEYQTQTWSVPARLALTELHRDADKITLEARILDAKEVLCLDARTRVRFSLAGDGRMIDNLGTPSGSRVVELANGRARITIQRSGSQPIAVAIHAKEVTGTVLTLA